MCIRDSLDVRAGNVDLQHIDRLARQFFHYIDVIFRRFSTYIDDNLRIIPVSYTHLDVYKRQKERKPLFPAQ